MSPEKSNSKKKRPTNREVPAKAPQATARTEVWGSRGLPGERMATLRLHTLPGHIPTPAHAVTAHTSLCPCGGHGR